MLNCCTTLEPGTTSRVDSRIDWLCSKLCKTHATFVMSTTNVSLASVSVWNILHLAANSPKVFSTTHGPGKAIIENMLLYGHVLPGNGRRRGGVPVWHARVTLPQKDSGVKIAAARNTLESLWRPPKALWSLPGGRRIDSVYAKTILAQGRITLNNNNKKSPKVIVLGRGKWLSLLMNLKISFRRKNIHLRDMIIQEKQKISGEQLQNFIHGTRPSTLWSSMEINTTDQTVVVLPTAARSGLRGQRSGGGRVKQPGLGRSQTAAGSWASAGSWKLAAGGSWSASHGASVCLFS
ncbi:hypothetical protein PoB_004845400 [Plakobranchus ocellatus]|uniref:Uncharacterized protein n=1 Tax=Plakobranchus ocellatus TaxID=259542 RepID=A0AAV4BPC0_9GAST|nr:hypothetical protein PoB_004845400 [Plakobranchus ocellatus]